MWKKLKDIMLPKLGGNQINPFRSKAPSRELKQECVRMFNIVAWGDITLAICGK